MEAKTESNILFKIANIEIDRFVTYMMIGLWLFGILISFHFDTWFLGVGMGSVLLGTFLIAARTFPTQLISRLVASTAMALYMIQYLAQLQGLYEMHFWFFIMPMFLIIYQDWRVFVPFSTIIVAHHFGIYLLVNKGQNQYLSYFINMNSLNNMTFFYHMGLAMLGVASAGGVSYKLREETKERYENAEALENQLQEMESVALNVKTVAERIAVRKNSNTSKSVSESLAEMGLAFNEIIDKIVEEIKVVVEVASQEGNLSSRMEEKDKYGVWKVLSVSINKLLSSVARPVMKINQVVNNMSNGVLNDHIETQTKGQIKELFDNMNMALSNLRILLKKVSLGVNELESATSEMVISGSQMDASTNEIANSNSKMSSGTYMQLKAIEKTSQILEVVMSGSAEMQEDAEKINRAAREGFESSETGKQIVDIVVNDINRINEFSEKTFESIQTLSDRSKEISTMLNVINEIASQTNLLALNAAIEAAQAGENGRGFAVVADEIKKLAEDARKSTKEIEGIIGVVLNDTMKATEMMSEMKKNVNSGVESTQKANEMFNLISEGTKKTLYISKNLLGTTNNQTNKINEVVGNMESVVMISEQTAAGAKEVASLSSHLSKGMKDFKRNSKNLNKMGKDLKDSMNKFTLD